ncbi:helix-turn-helix transcriptional regulator [Dactylosporangium sp. NPDC049525]|uniref:helix-turn-helix domain-containing protein n=1 Tax=Dactylosporangium sp. NPDC049525 TaxID=3154730 RepID=UPI003429C556
MGPAVARDLLRWRLKALREASELSPSTVATHAGWSVSKLTRIEKGDVTIQPLEVRALLQYYGVDDKDEMAALAKLSRVSRARQWYSRHRLVGDFQRFVAYESEAATINIWQPLFVPDLLQTEAYARAITALSMRRSPDDKEVLARVRLCMDRQQAFRARLRKANPPHLVAVIDESVLRRPVGGYEVQRQQLDHLLDLAENDAVYTIAVTPLNLEHHSGLSGTFELLQFRGEERGDVLLVQAAAGVDALITDPGITSLFRDLLGDLMTHGRIDSIPLDMIRSARAAVPTPSNGEHGFGAAPEGASGAAV